MQLANVLLQAGGSGSSGIMIIRLILPVLVLIVFPMYAIVIINRKRYKNEIISGSGFLKTKLAIVCYITIVGFFLPWINILMVSISGMSLPDYARLVASTGTNKCNDYLAAYLLYLIPISSIYILWTGYNTKYWSSTFSIIQSVPACVLIFLGYIFLNIISDNFSFNIFSFGFYVTCIGSIGLYFMSPEERKFAINDSSNVHHDLNTNQDKQTDSFFCSKCGNKLVVGSTFCSKCGNKVE